MVKNIESEKVSYLLSQDKDFAVGDTLQVVIRDNFFTGGRAFFKGEHSKLNDGSQMFENCLKCGKSLKRTVKPLCYGCWKYLVRGEGGVGNNKNTGVKEERKQITTQKNNEMSFEEMGRSDDLFKIRQAFNTLAAWIKIQEEIVNFSFANVKDGLNSLENKFDGKKRRNLRNIIHQFEEVDKDFSNFSEIKGYLFEIATHQILEDMKSKEYGIAEIKPSYERSLKEPDYRYESDGEIQFRLAKKDIEDVWALYDCKAYSNGYNIKFHLEKMISYLKNKQDNLRGGRKFKYFIVISSKFTGKPQDHIEKLPESVKADMRLILITGKQLLRLYDEGGNRIWKGTFYEKFPWEEILEPDTKSPIHLVQDQEITKLIKKARENP